MDFNGVNSFGTQPQDNQYLSGEAQDPNNSTQWMQPSFGTDSTLNPNDVNVRFDPSKNSGNYDSGEQYRGTGIDQQPRNNGGTIPLADGTAIGQVTSGWMLPSNFNIAAPLGFDQSKWNDPTKGSSLKYQAGRMAADLLSQGLSAKDITGRIAQQFGAKQISDDAIQYPDGFIADLFFDVGGPNQRVQYTDVTPRDEVSGLGDILGIGSGNTVGNEGIDQAALTQLAQRLFQQFQNQRQLELEKRTNA